MGRFHTAETKQSAAGCNGERRSGRVFFRTIRPSFGRGYPPEPYVHASAPGAPIRTANARSGPAAPSLALTEEGGADADQRAAFGDREREV
jgi:hypothetical protein